VFCLTGLLLMAACSTAPPRATAAEALAHGEPITAARMQLQGNEVVMLAVPIDPVELPAAARTTVDAIAPQGETTFVGRERGPRGEGFRVDKRYETEDGGVHTRSLLVDASGDVLERSHSVPVPDVPKHVLAAALGNGRYVDDVCIVSGPEREEHWALTVHDRRGRRHVVIVSLSGEELARWRRSDARVDAAAGIR